MTVNQWLDSNYVNGCLQYAEAVMHDANGNSCEFWDGDNDEKYGANVLRVESADGITAHLYTDYTETV